MEQRTSGRAQVLVSRPLVNWKDALADLSAHSSLDYHLNSEAKFEAFIRSMAEPKTRVDLFLTAATQDLVARNRAILTSIMKCVELCGRQGLPLRGHRDDSTSTDLSQGNFRAVINFRVDFGDTFLRDHLSECSSRQTYISKTSQNKILLIMGESIRNQIIAEVKDSGFYSISIDEVTDVANWEQLGIILRYVKEGQAIEKLVGFEAWKKGVRY